MEVALRQEGLIECKLAPKRPKVWSPADGNITRFFMPHAYRRPWGFVYSGSIGIEIPSLRQWLRQHKPGNAVGIFHTCFVSYVIANEDALCDFMVEHDQPVPSDLWAGLLRDRLHTLPSTLADLVAAYRRNREELGWLAHPYDRHAWDFLLRWIDDPDPLLHVPKMSPTGRIY